MKTSALAVALAISFGGAAFADIRGMDHVALTVPNLGDAKSYFEKAFGCLSAYDLGPFADDKGTWMADNLGTDARAKLNIAVMQCGNASNVELMEFSSEKQNTAFPARQDYGAASVGFYVDDLEASVKQVQNAGGELMGQINSVGEGPIAGRTWAYTRAPWGQLVFLMNDGDGVAYDRQDGAVKMFSPRTVKPVN